MDKGIDPYTHGGPAGASFANGNGPDNGRPEGQVHWWLLV
jgi:hypothetical protein